MKAIEASGARSHVGGFDDLIRKRVPLQKLITRIQLNKEEIKRMVTWKYSCRNYCSFQGMQLMQWKSLN
jgi:hypothetical protein